MRSTTLILGSTSLALALACGGAEVEFEEPIYNDIITEPEPIAEPEPVAEPEPAPEPVAAPAAVTTPAPTPAAEPAAEPAADPAPRPAKGGKGKIKAGR